VKVLHVHNVAYVPEMLCRALAAEGAEAQFVEDAAGSDLSAFDIVHVHYAVNRISLRAIRMAAKAGRPVVLHHHGSDVRLVTAAGMRPLPPWWAAVSRWARRRAAATLLATPDLVDFCPSGTYVPNPVDLDAFRPMAAAKSGRILICGRQVKGSRLPGLLDPAKEYDSINTGHPIKMPGNVRELRPVPRAEFPEFLNLYSEMVGAIGDLVTMARLEAMACGLRTFSDFDERYVSYYSGENPDKTANPRAFVERHHDSRMVARKVIAAYEGVLRS
jgi:glycosyltransferase involved in cell wall biosynthesis